MKRKIVKAVCEDCNGTGVFIHPIRSQRKKNTGIVCWSCDGRGWNEIAYLPFKKRGVRKGLKYVLKNRRDGHASILWDYSVFKLLKEPTP